MIARRGSPLARPGRHVGPVAPRSSTPSPTSIPTTACSIDLATDHESSGVSTVTGRPGPSKRGSVAAVPLGDQTATEHADHGVGVVQWAVGIEGGIHPASRSTPAGSGPVGQSLVGPRARRPAGPATEAAGQRPGAGQSPGQHRTTEPIAARGPGRRPPGSPVGCGPSAPAHRAHRAKRESPWRWSTDVWAAPASRSACCPSGPG